MNYLGRFAPSPNGALHAGSLVAALAAWLDARAHGGRWLLRFENVDGPRSMPGIEHLIVQQLGAVGLEPDAPPLWQSQRGPFYAQALERLRELGPAYPCGCTRRDIDERRAARQPRSRHGELVYPGTCRSGSAAAAAPRLATLRRSMRRPVVDRLDDRRLGAAAPGRRRRRRRLRGAPRRRLLGLPARRGRRRRRHRASPTWCAARTWPTTRRGKIHLQRLLGLPTPRYLHYAAGAGRRRREAVEAERRRAVRREAAAAPARGGHAARSACRRRRCLRLAAGGDGAMESALVRCGDERRRPARAGSRPFRRTGIMER
jgi:glutamyl-Q tRNA(Asp) synthetase